MSKKRDPSSAVLEYLNQQNRPYSATDIFNNLRKEFGKTVIVKTLETLAEEDKITEKTYGKQKIYAPLQDQYGEYNEEELKSLDNKIKEFQAELNVYQQDNKSLENQINSLSSQLTTADALAKIQTLEDNNQLLSKKLATLQGGAQVMTKEEIKQIQDKREKSVGFWRKRKRMTTDILDSILEGYPKSKKELLEETGVETDEEVGVKLPK